MNNIKFTDGDISRTKYIDNMFVLNFVYAIIHISNNEESKNEAGLIPDTNIKFDDGIEEMLNELLSDLEKEIYDFMHLEKHFKISDKLKSRVEMVMHEVISSLYQYNISLEVLAMYIMYKNFAKAEILHENFKQFTDETKYSLITDTMDASGFSLKDKINMNKIASEVIIRIKRK